MICKHCGCETPAGDAFCAACGKPVEQEPVTATQDNVLYSAEERSADGRSILTFSIVGLAISACALPLIGLIFSFIARSKLGKYLAKYRETCGPATVGKHLSLAGVIFGIAYAAFWVLYFILVFGLALLSSSGGYYY